jgi:hypothetical protein
MAILQDYSGLYLTILLKPDFLTVSARKLCILIKIDMKLRTEEGGF